MIQKNIHVSYTIYLQGELKIKEACKYLQEG